MIFEKGYLSPNQPQIYYHAVRVNIFGCTVADLSSAASEKYTTCASAFYWLTCFSNCFILLFHSHSWTKLLASTSSCIVKVVSEDFFFIAASPGMATCSYSELASMCLLSTSTRSHLHKFIIVTFLLQSSYKQ